MHMDDGRTFLLAARKRKKAASSHYVISSSPQDLSRSSSSYFGKLKANFVGTQFSVQCKSSVLASTAAKGSLAVSSSAQSPAKRLTSSNSRDGRQTRDIMGSDGGAGGAEPLMQEVGAVTFGYNVLGTRGPRRMNVAVPAVHHADGSHRWRSMGPDDTLAERIK
jgi:tubby-related protein 1